MVDLVLFFLVLILPSAAGPLPWRESKPSMVARGDRAIITQPGTGQQIVVGTTSNNGTVFSVVSVLCAILLAYLLGSRARTLKDNVLRRNNITSILVIWLFTSGIGFIICTTVVESGQSLRTYELCYSAIIICLVFYTGNKLAIYVFLLERARIVRAPFVPRRKDMLWIVGMIFICGGFGVIAIVGYITPVVELSGLDGRCRIGLPSKVSLPLMSFDIGVNVLLTGMFLYLLKPMLAHHHLLSMRGLFGEKRCERVFGEKGGKLLKGWCSRLGGMGRPATGSIQYTDAQKKAMSRHIKVLLIKCLVGSSLVMMPTLGNMIQFYVMQGRELGWICLTLCTLDVTSCVLIVHWLTIGSAKAEKHLTSFMTLTLTQQTTHTQTGLHQQVIPSPVPTPEGSAEDLYQPRILQDAGKLLVADPGVSPIHRPAPVDRRWQIDRRYEIDKPSSCHLKRSD